MTYKNLTLIILWLVVCGPVEADTDFFWSTEELRSGAVNNAGLSLNLNVGDFASVFLFYSTNGPANSDIDTGAFLDIASQTAGVIELLSAETFDFEIIFPQTGAEIFRRWQGFGTTGDISTDGQSLIGWNAFNVADAVGIAEMFNGETTFLDTGYDPDSDSFLFGRLDFSATSPGVTSLVTTAGVGGIVNDGQSVPATFGNLTITVIPEPCATFLFFMFGVPTSGVRRRSRSF